MIGRLAPTTSDELDSELYEAEYGGRTYAGRRKINLVPMISPNLPPGNRHRPYVISQNHTLIDKTKSLFFNRSTILGTNTIPKIKITKEIPMYDLFFMY